MITVNAHQLSMASFPPLYTRLRSRSICSSSSPVASTYSFALFSPPFNRHSCTIDQSRRATTVAAVISSGGNSMACDLMYSAMTYGVNIGLFRSFQELTKHGILEPKLNRKLVHITIGMVYLLFWPLFSSGRYAPFVAALAPGINIIRVLLLGLGITKNEAVAKSTTMSRSGDHREVLKAPLFYVTAITFTTSVLWRTSHIAIAIICNLYAGDGVADIVGRRLGKEKLPYNPNKSYAGSIAMAVAGFLASIGCMHYLHSFGFIEESWYMAFGFLVVSVAATLVESHPISTELDDNLTVPLTAFLVGSIIL